MPGREFFLWQVRFFTVRLALDFVEKLAWQLEDQRLNPAEEHGGMLFGRVIDKDTVEVTGFEFIPSEHHRGVLYDPGARERARIAKYVRSFSKRRSEKPVGYFRTHLRPGLFLDQDDFALMLESFSDIPSIALVIRPDDPGAPNGGIFFWEDEDIDRKQTQLAFPFEAGILRTQGPIDREIPAARTTGKTWAARLKASRALVWGGGVALAALAIAVGAALHVSQTPRSGENSVHASSPRGTQGASSQPTPFPPGQADPQSETNAPPAVFEDGPGTPGPEGAGNDGTNERPSPWRPPAAAAARTPSANPKSSRPEPGSSGNQPDLRNGAAARGSDGGRPAPAAAPVVLPPPPTIAPAPAAMPVLPERPVTVEVVMEYKEPVGLKKIAGHIPLLGHLQTFHNESDYSPPRPTGPLKPHIPPDLTSILSEEVAVDVVVSIDKSGAVKNTEITKGAGTGFATLAADAAGSVSWEPAKAGDRNIATNVVLHYRFNPAQ
jgi:hypothetical protein